MLGFLLLSPFPVVFLASCARQGPQQGQGGHFSTWAVTGQGWQKGQGSAVTANRDGIPLCSEGTQLTIPTRTRSGQYRNSIRFSFPPVIPCAEMDAMYET